LRDPPDAGEGEADAPATGSASGARPAIGAARKAPLQRWLARVWPALALGGGAIDRGWVGGAIKGALLRPALAEIAGFLSAVGSASRAAGSSTLDVPPVANEPRPALADEPAPVGGERTAYLVLLIALLALLAYTIWVEFRSALRTHHPR
jgi:hypothetical protein